ncbi:hypothetical protein UB46_19720 [Burkholderiaceae bacterium 16]|nr:hypothetical protein UB46_19720 [Burkholderiaceae bacterium 16]
MPTGSQPASPSLGGRMISPTAIGAFALLLWATLPLLTAQARRLPPSELLALSFGVAFLMGLPWLAVLLLGAGPTGIAFVAWDHGTKHGRLALLGVLSYGTPLVAALLLVWFGFAMLTWTLACAAALIVGGAALAMMAPRPPALRRSA